MDLTAESIVDLDDNDFFENKCGKRNIFPIGTTRSFKGKEVHCLCYWIPKGYITSLVLTNILALVNHHDIYNRLGGVTSFLFTDWYCSYFEFLLLKYICNPLYHGSAFILVPYGKDI